MKGSIRGCSAIAVQWGIQMLEPQKGLGWRRFNTEEKSLYWMPRAMQTEHSPLRDTALVLQSSIEF